MREVLRSQLGLNASPPLSSSSSSASPAVHSNAPVVAGDARLHSSNARAPAIANRTSLSSEHVSRSEEGLPEAGSGGGSSEEVTSGPRSTSAALSSGPSSVRAPDAPAGGTVGSSPENGAYAGPSSTNLKAAASPSSGAVSSPQAPRVTHAVQALSSKAAENKTESRRDESEGGGTSHAGQKRTDLADGEPLKLGKVAFHPGDYEFLILRMSKPSKFTADFRGSTLRDKRGPFDRRTHRRRHASRLSTGPSSLSTEKIRQINDFGEYYVLLHGLLSHHRVGFPKANPLPDPPAFLLEKRAVGGGASGQPGSENDMRGLLSELNAELGRLSRDTLRKLRAEAFGACAFLSFFGLPDAEGRLELPGGWPRDLELALRCVVEGNKNRQFCATCFLIDGEALGGQKRRRRQSSKTWCLSAFSLFSRVCLGSKHVAVRIRTGALPVPVVACAGASLPTLLYGTFCVNCLCDIAGLATALGFPPVVARSDAWAVSQEAGVKSLYVLHRRPDAYKAPGLLAEATNFRSDGRSAPGGSEEIRAMRTKTSKITWVPIYTKLGASV